MEKSRKKLKKALAVILALAMIISLVNVPAIGSEAASKKKTVKSVTVSNLPAKTLTLKKNKTFKLKTKVSVTGGASKAVIYKSSKPKVAKVSSKGVITAKKKGKTVITITSKADKSKKCKITVTVGTPATKVSIKASKNYVAAGKTLKLKATVTPKKASNKKVVWSSSNKKVATVTSKGVVKGVKSGTATITAKAADGSGKKAKFKVNVVVPVKISGVSVENPLSVKVVLDKAQKLSVSNFKVSTKQYDNGTYNRNCIVDSIKTTDYKTYILTLNSSGTLSENNMVKVTVNGLVGSSSKEVRYSAGKFTYNNEKIYRATLNEYSEGLLYPYGYGYSIYTVKNLPAGIKYRVADNGESARLYGTPTKAGSYNATVSCKDELGNIINYTVKFIIGSKSSIAAASFTKYLVTGAGGTVDIDYYPFDSGDDYVDDDYVTGGSGSYKYAIYGANYELTMSEYGRLSGTLRGAGTYNLKVKITDANNSKLSTTATVTIKVVQGFTVAGIVKDANGNPIPDAEITFTNKDKSSQYVTSKYTSTNNTGAYSVYLPSGTYDVQASYGDTVIYLYNQKITGSKSGYDLSLPLYKVAIYSNNKNISSSDFGTWYDSTHKRVGSGNALYLKAGTYKLSTNEKTSGFYTYKASLTITVKKSMVATAAVTVTSNSVKGSVGANGIVQLNFSSDGSMNYYKFTPSDSGKWRFYTSSSFNAYGRLYNADGSSYYTYGQTYGGNDQKLFEYNLTAGTTYYIGIRGQNSSDNGHSCTLKVSRANISITNTKNTISSNGYATLNLMSDYVYYRFTPQTSGTYYFYSESSSDTYGVLCAADGSEITSNDDGNGRDFLISSYCTAGTTYYIGVRAYSDSYAGNSCTLKVSNEQPEY